VQWHDSKDGKDKQAKIGGGEQTYKLNIPEPKSDKPKNRKTAHAALPYDYSSLHLGPQFIANA